MIFNNDPMDLLTDDEVLRRATILTRRFKDYGLGPADSEDADYSDRLIEEIHTRNLNWGGEDHPIAGDDDLDVELDADELTDVTYEVTITLGADDPLPGESELEGIIVKALDSRAMPSVDSVRVRRQ